jgi:hypothetical protein
VVLARCTPVALGLLAFAAAPALGGDTALLPDVSIYLEAARYQPVEIDQGWTGWIGAGAGLVRLAGFTPYFSADIESLLGHRNRPFEATQINYHLEPGIRREIGAFTTAFFFHHVSRHAVDRAKAEAVDWNIMGVRATGPLSRSVAFHLSVGHTTQQSLVGYQWEVIGGLALGAEGPLYAAADVRWVTVEPDPAFPRGDFADVRAEAGGRWAQGRAVLQVFAGLERRNDVDLLLPAVRNRFLLGFRIGGRDQDGQPDIYRRP